jgi:hypothetical protein
MLGLMEIQPFRIDTPRIMGIIPVSGGTSVAAIGSIAYSIGRTVIITLGESDRFSYLTSVQVERNI